MEQVEEVVAEGRPLAYLIRAEATAPETLFVTPPDLPQQAGFVVYGAGQEVPRHSHPPVERRIVGTSEVLVVRRGRCELEIYDERRELVAKRNIAAGDIVVLVGGGHCLRMLEDTILLEFKQGPYMGPDDKERF